MADSYNGFSNLAPLFKESYAKGPMSTHERPGNDKAVKYNTKINKLAIKPNSSKQYFSTLKRKLKENKKVV